MRIVTSFGPSRIDRQQRCLKSWITSGHRVTAVQSAGEAAVMSQHFPSAEFVETDLVADKFGKPHFIRIKALTDLAVSESVLIVNSDIQFVGDPNKFSSQWCEPEPGVLKMGIRWDRNPRTQQKRVFKWGVDAFLVTPKIAEDLPDVGLAIGCPAWDYWIPWHLNTLGYKFETLKEYHLDHEVHDRSWSSHDYEVGLQIMKSVYNVDSRPLAQFVQIITGRERLKNWRTKL